MRFTLLLSAIFASYGALAFDKSEVQGSWTMEKAQCASGAEFSFVDSEMKGKMNITKLEFDVNFLDAEKAQAKVDLGWEFSESYKRQARQEYTKALQDLKKMERTPEVAKSIADIKKSQAETEKLMQTQECSGIYRLTYYIRGKTFYTNEVNQLTNCSEIGFGKDSDDDIELEAATIEIKGGKLVITEGQEVQKGQNCPIGDRTVYTFKRK